MGVQSAMNNRDQLTITSAIADKATLTAEPVMAYKFGRNVPAILVSVRDGVNSEASFIYLDIPQTAKLTIWLVTQLVGAMTPSEFANFVASVGTIGRLNEVQAG